MHEPSPLLSLPASRVDRWRLLESLIERWCDGPDIKSGFSTDDLRAAEENRGFAIPLALTEWYSMNGKARSVWSCQDEFLPPNRMHLQNEALIFYMENQAIVKWGIPIDLISADDPPVVVSSVEKADIWVPQTDNLSKFAIYMFAFSLQFSFRKSWVCGPAEPEMVQLITSRFPKLEFPDHWWTGDLLYGYDDLIVSISDGRYVHAVALSDDALSTFLKLATDETFEAVASSDN